MTTFSFRGVWKRQGICGKLLWLSLLPASVLYRIVIQVRNALFAYGWLKSTWLPRPVIGIGNLTVGGTGKTPTCIWLAQELKRRGYNVGILSRGYRRQGTAPVVLSANPKNLHAIDSDDGIFEAGDEPVMMARLYGQPVAVGKDRIQAAAELLRNLDVDVFILDDGFQHRRVRRDFDLLLLGNDSSGSVLPAGPFREPRRNLRRASGLLITGDNERWKPLVPRDLATASFVGSLQPVSLIGFGLKRWNEFPLTLLHHSKILTVTGIANAEGLYQFIHEWEGELIDTLEFPDHHLYTNRDWQQINRMARLVDLIITTEKDILKLIRFPFARDKLLALRVAMTVENGAALVGAIVDKIEQARERNR